MKTADFDYDLPSEYIAQTPIEPRDASRLMVLDRASDRIIHTHFFELGKFLRAGDLLVVNETRVIPARIFGRKIPSGGRVEVLLLAWRQNQTWEALVGGKGLVKGKHIQIEGGPEAEIVEVLSGARRLIRFSEAIDPVLKDIGQMPLPPYIHTPLVEAERYQTVYARVSGSAAAPTAGLHFTPRLVEALETAGIRFTKILLHVGLDTFAPVSEETPQEHVIHTEWCQISPESAELINQTKAQGGRVIAVGTTSVRTLESAAAFPAPGESVTSMEGPTNLFILPGYQFKVVDAMITNFHLPRSSLIMLVSAFAGKEKILSAYELAKTKGYRFYSFGDAMFLG
ncbi:MAG TPA: tRNA preQ1(34) S-adenosylmethionine ribosyltransferase-isomerase QueA [Anaerolineales bacterium]|nr:tRNA preQ1(34) S-adenosylmethionine ribosyltransferase-isomerase QueA [Anaerolineales bacterium]